MKSAPCESSADVFFMLDNMPAQEVGNKEEIEIITQVAKTLNLGRNYGSVSVLVNSQGSSNPSIVDENNQPINVPLYAIAYNTTSSQCASCRAAWFDNSTSQQIFYFIQYVRREYETYSTIEIIYLPLASNLRNYSRTQL